MNFFGKGSTLWRKVCSRQMKRFNAIACERLKFVGSIFKWHLYYKTAVFIAFCSAIEVLVTTTLIQSYVSCFRDTFYFPKFQKELVRVTFWSGIQVGHNVVTARRLHITRDNPTEYRIRMHKPLSFTLLSSKMSAPSKRSTLLGTLKVVSAKLRLFPWR